ncbi:7 transmembrane receptor [Ostertagia ostertagi]
MLDLFNLLGWGDFWNGEDLPSSASSRLVHIVNISQSQPPWLARPLYGLAAPAIILVTLVTNSFVIVVLSNKNLRTPTNYILLSMAITELMTGLSSCPWFLYYYTFGGLYVDQEYGLPDFWCKTHPYFAVHLPTIFHTAAIWLTVYLAIQRYIYVCLPSLVVRFCTPRKTRHIIIYICICASLSELPVMCTEYSVSVMTSNTTRSCFHKDVDIIDSVISVKDVFSELPVMCTEYSVSVMTSNTTRSCFHKDVDIIDSVIPSFQVIGVDSWKALILCLRALLVHILPCVLLIIFTTCLFKTVNEADRKRSVHQLSGRKMVSRSGCRSHPFLVLAESEI